MCGTFEALTVLLLFFNFILSLSDILEATLCTVGISLSCNCLSVSICATTAFKLNANPWVPTLALCNEVKGFFTKVDSVLNSSGESKKNFGIEFCLMIGNSWERLNLRQRLFDMRRSRRVFLLISTGESGDDNDSRLDSTTVLSFFVIMLWKLTVFLTVGFNLVSCNKKRSYNIYNNFMIIFSWL